MTVPVELSCLGSRFQSFDVRLRVITKEVAVRRHAPQRVPQLSLPHALQRRQRAGVNSQRNHDGNVMTEHFRLSFAEQRQKESEPPKQEETDELPTVVGFATNPPLLALDAKVHDLIGIGAGERATGVRRQFAARDEISYSLNRRRRCISVVA
jgi:hypothetical protein